MRLFNFLKDAGEKIFGSSDNIQDKSVKATTHVQNYQIPGSKDIKIVLNEEGVATITGECDTEAIKQLIIVAAGNIEGVKEVNDQIQLKNSPQQDNISTPGEFYEVKKGDTLSKIAKQFYNDSNQYMLIFEANKPMLTHPDKIYVGQILIIPKI